MAPAKDVAFVGADGALGSALAGDLGARGVRLRCPDLTDATPLAVLAEADVVINAAGPRHHPELQWSDYFREHVGTATRVARSMRPGAYLVHVSSAAVYGSRRRFADAATPEDPSAFPAESYAWAKLAAEHAVRAICAERGVRLTVLRPSIIYGPGSGGVLLTLRRIAARGVRFVLTPPEARQHLLHMDLFRRVLEALVERGASGDFPMLVLADPFVLTTRDVNDALRRAGPRAVPVPVPLALAAAAIRAWQHRLEIQAPAHLAVAAMLALDNEYDWRPSFQGLGLDPAEFGREKFERFMDEG
jgi:nucleoside-diphosphate-sugar epimerase